MKIKSKILAAGLTVIMLAGSAFATGPGSDPDGLNVGGSIPPDGVNRGPALDPDGLNIGAQTDPDGLQGQIMTLLRLLIG